MKTRLYAIALQLALAAAAAAAANAQQLVPYATARLTWEWSKGTVAGTNDGDVTEFRMKCGSKPGAYDVTTPVKDPNARQVFVRDIVKTNGVYYCAITAANPHGESPPSNEVFFSAGAVPSSPANLAIP